MIDIATETVAANLWDQFIAWISHPLGFIIFILTLTLLSIWILYIIVHWDSIKRWLLKNEVKSNEFYAMYSKQEWQKRNVYVMLLGILIGGLLIGGALYLMIPSSFNLEKQFWLIITITFSIVIIPGVPLLTWKYYNLYRTIKIRYKRFLSEKESLLSMLKGALEPQLHLPDIEAKFVEIGLVNGQCKKIFKMLSGRIIEAEY